MDAERYLRCMQRWQVQERMWCRKSTIVSIPTGMLDVVEREGLREAVMQSILAAIEKHVAGRIGDAMRFGVIVFSEKYGYLGQTSDADNVLDVFRGKQQM